MAGDGLPRGGDAEGGRLEGVRELRVGPSQAHNGPETDSNQGLGRVRCRPEAANSVSPIHLPRDRAEFLQSVTAKKDIPFGLSATLSKPLAPGRITRWLDRP